MAVDLKQLQLRVFGDSQLVIEQLLGSYEIKKPELRPYHNYAQKLMGWLGEVTLQHVPRRENKQVNALATLASILILPNQTQVIVHQEWLVPPSNEDKDIKGKVEYLVVVSKAVKKD